MFIGWKINFVNIRKLFVILSIITYIIKDMPKRKKEVGFQRAGLKKNTQRRSSGRKHNEKVMEAPNSVSWNSYAHGDK